MLFFCSAQGFWVTFSCLFPSSIRFCFSQRIAGNGLGRATWESNLGLQFWVRSREKGCAFYHFCFLRSVLASFGRFLRFCLSEGRFEESIFGSKVLFFFVFLWFLVFFVVFCQCFRFMFGFALQDTF